MPAKKKAKPKPDVWIIKCDGLRIDEAPTKAQAVSKKDKWEKLYPPQFKFEVALLRL